MNSWISRPLSACAPPLMMFISGVGQRRALRAAEVAPERQADGVGRGARDRHRDAEDGVGADLRLVRRAVGLEEDAIDLRLVERVETDDARAERLHDVVDGLHARPCRRSASCRRRGARSPRARRSTRRSGRRRGRGRSAVWTSTSTVGLPRESRISRAMTAVISLMGRSNYHESVTSRHESASMSCQNSRTSSSVRTRRAGGRLARSDLP